MISMDNEMILNTLVRFDEDIPVVLESLANRRRLQLLTSLLREPQSFHILQNVTGLGKTALAHHLGKLVKTGLIKRTHRSRYELTRDGLELLNAVSAAYAHSKRRRELEAARRADYIQKTHSKGGKKPVMKELEISIVRLEPMHIASVQAISNSPERDAWAKMREWAEPKGLLENPEKNPVFGFNNPDPSPDRKDYGYEFWVRVESDIKPEGKVEIKNFAGGLYAVATCKVRDDPGKDIPETWRKLAEWVKSSKYKLGKHQWLEKAHDPAAADEELVLDLYCPIQE